ncbi:MAG: M23 family peptidase [Muribaculaceae bacterium]|nr:M23 family peptidase [Muribaculaceae bacterium]
MIGRSLSVLLIGLSCGIAVAQSHDADLHSPLSIPLTLSGNFGELRNNHFHSGLDFKTNGRTGYKIYCAADGYVSRIVVSPWGFGRAVYVTHPDLGLTTVYGHLESFSTKIDTLVRRAQYDREAFSVDLTFTPGEIPVTKGEVIALSGNSGSSGGPHLHMDVRDTATGDALDPMPYFRNRITDRVAPEVRQVALYPVDGSVVDGQTSPSYRAPAELSRQFTAWGTVIPGIKAYDRMTGTSNIYGIKYLTLKVDGQEVYRRVIDRVDFNRSRASNTLIYYPDKYHRGSWVMITRQADSAPLASMITESGQGGVLNIDQERDYKCEFIMEDDHGNRSSAKFTVKGVPSVISSPNQAGTPFHHNKASRVSGYGLVASFPAGTFYDDLKFTTTFRPDSSYVSHVYTVGDPAVPLSGSYDMTIDLTRDDMSDKSKYCIVRISGKKRSAIATTYDSGKVTGRPNQLGDYAVTTDTEAPVAMPVNKAGWSKSGNIVYRLTDNLSGVQTYRGEIDGQFVLFELDGKTGKATFRLSPDRVKKGKSHTVTMTVTDACGNQSTSTDRFTW